MAAYLIMNNFSSNFSQANQTANEIFLSETLEQFIQFSSQDWIKTANQHINEHDAFFVALSGGSTPLKIFSQIVKEKQRLEDPTKIFLFWGDERLVPPTSSDSNYGQAMRILSELSIPEKNIFRIQTEYENCAEMYQEKILSTIPNASFDLVMLGMGSDGHTLSLFPQTSALSETHRLVIKNAVPQLNTERITLTLPAVKKAKRCVVYVQGSNKKPVLEKILSAPSQTNLFPIELVSKAASQLFWIIAPDSYKNTNL